MKKCDICGKENTEFATFKIDVDLRDVNNRVHLKRNNFFKSAVVRYIGKVLKAPLEKDLNICQTCVSKTFRNFKKNV